MRIEDLRAINHSVLKYSFTVVVTQWSDFYLKECKLFEKDGKRWVTFPDREYEKNGEKKYMALCGFKTKELSEAFKEKVKDALKAHIASSGNPMPHNEDMPF